MFPFCYKRRCCEVFFSEGWSERPPRMLKFFSGLKVGGRWGKKGVNAVFKEGRTDVNVEIVMQIPNAIYFGHQTKEIILIYF